MICEVLQNSFGRGCVTVDVKNEDHRASIFEEESLVTPVKMFQNFTALALEERCLENVLF